MERKFEIGEVVLLTGSCVDHTPNTYYLLKNASIFNECKSVSCGGYYFDEETGKYNGSFKSCLDMRINHCDNHDGVKEMIILLSDIFGDLRF